MVRRLGNATLDGGLISLVQYGFEAVLHAAEVECTCTDRPDARQAGMIGRVNAKSQPYDERYVLLRCFMQKYWP